MNSSLALPTDTNTPLPRKLGSGAVGHNRLRDIRISSSAATNNLNSGGINAAAYPRPGDLFLGFNILEKLGEGGFGSVFLAEEVKLAGRLVALKFTNRPNKEPERLASLQHTNIVPVYSVHTMPPIQVLCMPYLGRQTLQGVVDSVASTRGKTRLLPQTGSALLSDDPTRPVDTKLAKTKSKTRSKSVSDVLNHVNQEALGLSPATQPPQPIRDRLHKLSFKESVVWLFTRLAEGLNHAHERGILHLDMKPTNILMTDDGVPMILDFGLAYDTKSGNYDQAGGTPRYMAPEQIIGYANPGKVLPDARMDLYALGLMFYELLTGVHPFEASCAPGTSIRTMLEARKCQPSRVRTLNSNVDPAVEAIVLKLLQPDPEKRYQSAEDLLTDLVLHQENRPVKFAGNPSVWERVKKMRRRHPILAVCMVAGMLALSTTGAVATAAHQARQRSQAEATLMAKQFDTDLKVSRIDLTTMDRAEDRKAAIRKAEAMLAQYEVEGATPWRTQSAVEHLPPDERKMLERDLVELAALLAHANRLNALFEKDTQKAESYDRALHFNALATKLNDGKQILAGLEMQREEILHLAKLSNEAPRANAPMSEPLDFYLAGLSGMASGQYGNAVDAYKKLLEVTPEHAAGQLNLGWVYQYQGLFTEASERFQLAKVLASNDPRPAFNRGVLMQFHRKYQSALDEFNTAVARDPKFATTYYYRAVTYRRMGKLEEALVDCGRAIDGKEMVYASLILRSEIHDQQGKKEEAARDRETVLKHQPKSESEFFARGRSKLATDPIGALDDFNRAIELNPRYLSAWMNKAQVLNGPLAQPQQALEALDRVMELHPRSANCLAMQALILACMGKKDLAHAAVEKLKPWTDDAGIWFDCACVYALTGEREQALSYFRKSLRDGYSDFEKIAKAKDLDSIRDTVAFADALNAAKTLQVK